MANIDKQDFYWDGKLAGAINLLYSDLLNVDVVKPAYSWGHRNSSFFLQTRLGYIAEYRVQKAMSDHHSNWGKDYVVTDVKVIYDTSCSDENGTIYILVQNQSKTNKILLTGRIENGCFVEGSIGEPVYKREYLSDECGDEKLFITEGPKGAPKHLTNENLGGGIQVNKLEGGVYRGYFTTEGILEGTETWTNEVKAGDYIVVHDSTNVEGSGFAGQTRMVTGYSDDNKYIVLDTPWNGFRVADENGKTYKEVKGGGLNYEVYGEEGTILGMSNGNQIILFTTTTDRLIYTPTNGYIISIAESNGRIFALYNNGYVRYSRVGGRDQLFFDDEMYAGVDKSSLYAYRDFVLAFGKRSISVGTPTEHGNTIYYTMYQQSGSIGLKSRYSYGEYDGKLFFVSNDNRLMTLGVAATSGKYMLSFQDVGQEIIGGKLANMLDTDEAFVADYNNELRILVQSKPNPIKEDSKNSETHIYKFDSHFKTWTEDHLENILMRGYNSGIWYGTGGVYIKGLVTEGKDVYNVTQNGREGQAVDFRENPNLFSISNMTYKPNKVVAKVGAFLLEHEINGLTTNKTKAPGLFDLVKLNKLIVTLGYGKYSEYTKIRITSYRQGIGVVTEVNNLESNDWINLITLAYLGESLDEHLDLKEKKQCLIDTIGESQKQYQQECTAQDVRVTDLVKDIPWCEGSKRLNFQDHNICIDSSLYELAPHMPLVLNVGSTQNYSSQVKVEIISESGDILNFGGFLAELFVAPIGVKGADGENLIEMSSC